MENTTVLISSTNALYGYQIQACLGPIVIPVAGAGNIIRDWFGNITDFFGGKSVSYRKIYEQLLNQGMTEMLEQAGEYGANAIVGFRIETNSMPGRKSLVAIILYGTAVVAEPVI